MTVLILTFGPISGAHFNPAITLSYLRLGKIARWDAVFYVVSQFIGAVVGVAVLGSIINGQLTVNLVRKLTAIGIPQAYQSLVVSAVTTGTYQNQAKAATGHNHAITHIVNEVVSAAYGAFGHGLNLSLNVAGALLLASSVLALATVYGRRVHLERVHSDEGHMLHLRVEGSPGLA